MLKKQDMLPGTRLQINAQPKTGVALYAGYDQNIPYVKMTLDAGSMMEGHIAISPGDIVEVVSGPKRKNGTNTILVRDSAGFEGHVFWCEMRASATKI
jgi:hypothetical protein